MSAELLTPDEVGRRLGLKRVAVLEMARQGKIPRVKISRRAVRFEWEAVLKALKKAK